MAEKKPIRVQENPFGEFTAEQLAGAPLSDRFYLPGYSDKRHERELAMKAGKRPETLPRRFQFVSVERADTTPNRSKEVEWRAKGYRPVMWDEAESLGINLKESACAKAADGTVRVDSQLLMVADAAVAARHYREQRDLTDRQFEDHVRGPLEAAADKYNAKHGHTTKTGTKFEIVEDENADDD